MLALPHDIPCHVRSNVSLYMPQDIPCHVGMLCQRCASTATKLFNVHVFGV
jgi:hypothetical protein